ncbi:aminopeptidase N [Nocardioides sp. CBS4Y-1]|uniref:Aminopeptidase N n=1 Tax=Nocardioides acrostichi TaxID=2784339 RepID=A0A930Y938_9ACTN|nr:aminopeptidase N [Nocardioides acrostichi]
MGRAEAAARAALLDVVSYDLTLDLTTSVETFDSLTRIVVDSRAGDTFLDLKPTAVRSIHLDGMSVDVELLSAGRLPLALTEGRHEIVVDAVMPFRTDGEGLHRSVDPADERHYVYGMCFMDAAPTIFACFDQPDLKAPYTVHVRAPEGWIVRGNGQAENPEAGLWELATTPPLSTYFVTVVAGPYHLVTDEHDGIPLGLSARASLAADLDADADELFTLTRQCFDEFHRLFGVRYPFGGYHQAFVPEFNAGAMENPGCVTFRDPLVFSSAVTRGTRIKRAGTVAHEMAHQWFGNLVTPRWWDDLWLNESFAEYMGVRVTADVTEYHDAWVQNSYARRQWGLVADQRPTTHPVAGNGADDALTALQDFDGISYAKGSSILKQLAARMGDDVFLAGVRDHFDRHRFGNATMHDLLGSWTRAGAVGLDAFAAQWLSTAGPDRLDLDRDGRGVLLRTPPAEHPADRTHRLRLAVSDDGGHWHAHDLDVDAARTEVGALGDGAVLVDPWEDSWAVCPADPRTVAVLPDLLPRMSDPMLRAGAWNALRSGYHNAEVAPDDVVRAALSWLAVETHDAGPETVGPWLLRDVLPLCTDPSDAAERLHLGALSAARAASPGSSLQLSLTQVAIATCASPDRLESWLRAEGLPTGTDLDLELRWRILGRLAGLGAVDRSRLDTELDREPTGVSRVEHTRAVASLPDLAAKEFAWERFTGVTTAPNYEITAAGLGMWRCGQDDLLAPFVERYAADLSRAAAAHSGWVQGDAAAAFFPTTALSQTTVETMTALATDASLPAPVRRRLVDATDQLTRQVAVARRFGRS